jgi:outer membrane murein-binding lipoprotein Lpp
MTQPADLQGKVRQLDNDVQSIYEMLATIQATQARQGNRLDEMDGKLDKMDGKLDKIIRLFEGDK